MASIIELPTIINYNVSWIGVAFASNIYVQNTNYNIYNLLEWRFYITKNIHCFLIVFSTIQTLVPETHINLDKDNMINNKKEYNTDLYPLPNSIGVGIKHLFRLELESLDQFKRIVQKTFPQAEFTWLV